MRFPIAPAVLLVASSLAGCVAYGPMHGRLPDREEAPGSLFPADAAILPDDAIARILAHEWSAPGKARLAVLRIGQRSQFLRWSGEFARLEGQVHQDVLATLRGSPRVATVGELPSLLVPKDQTVGHLREAAARYRADLLLAWRADCRSYERFRFFARDEAKAHCDLEAVLLDVATGIVPFAAATSREYATLQEGDELRVEEASRRAEMRATGDALGEVARSVLAFLEGQAPAGR